MRKFLFLVLPVALSSLALGSPAMAEDAEPPLEPQASVLTIKAPTNLWAGESLPFVATLATAEGVPVAAKALTFTLNGSSKAVTTSTSGQAKFTTSTSKPATLSLGVAFAGDATLAPSTLVPVAYKTKLQGTSLTTSVASKAVDGKKVTVRVSGKHSSGRIYRGPVKITIAQDKLRSNTFIRTIKSSSVSIPVPVYRSSSVIVTAPAGAFYSAGKATTKRVGVAAGAPVVKLSGPRPSISLPAQRRASSWGSAVRISHVPDSVWRSMQGKSWRKGCTPRSSLRFIKANYWGFDGFRHEGQLVVAASAQHDFKRALQSMYAKKLPVRHMYLVDRFGYSKTLRGADDYKSMRADNTSAFNCRGVVGNPSVKSPHASGRSFDINPWENPYLSRLGWTPNTYWVGKSHSRVAWRNGSHAMVKAMRAAGFHWTYGARDAHHFDA